jgi:N-acetyl-anhydromuramyl-L-alanine amidase AmpD
MTLDGVQTKFREAKFYNRWKKRTGWSWIVIHCTESAREDTNRALKVASWFAKPWDSRRGIWRKASAHYVVDNRMVVQCVPEGRIAYHARGGNNRGLGVELVGKAAQSREEWLDAFGRDMLQLASALLAVLATTYEIPIVQLTPEGLIAGLKGITTHADVTRAFKVRGGHTDPGPNFPMDVLLESAAEKQVAISSEETAPA